MSTVFLILGITVFVIVMHEAIHLAVAYTLGTSQVGIHSWIPFKLRLDYPDTGVSLTGVRLMAIAPALVGLGIALLALITGGFAWLGQQEPVYLRRLAVLYWVLFAHVSPSDFRTLLHPDRDVPQNP